MVKQALACAEKNCNNKMILTENTGKLLYYNCQEKHKEHTFRYNIEQQKWEKIMIKTNIKQINYAQQYGIGKKDHKIKEI